MGSQYRLLYLSLQHRTAAGKQINATTAFMVASWTLDVQDNARNERNPPPLSNSAVAMKTFFYS